MSESRDKMVGKLKELVIPELKKRGFGGSFPHFRRLKEERLDVLTFQFSKWGGSFVVEAAQCPNVGVTLSWGEHVPPKEVKAHHIYPRLRLGSNPPEKIDHWFDFECATYGERIYQMMAEEVLMCLPQAESYWASKEKKPEANQSTQPTPGQCPPSRLSWRPGVG